MNLRPDNNSAVNPTIRGVVLVSRKTSSSAVRKIVEMLLVGLCACLTWCTLAEGALNFLILHTNDMHARFEETSRSSGTCREKKRCVGGFARTAHLVRKYRQAAKDGTGSPALFLNAGDTYVGTVWFSVHRWKIVAEFLNAVEPDAACLGNHEFDFGVEGLAPFVENAHFPILAANLDFSKEPSLNKTRNSVILNVADKKVGVVGYLTPETQKISSPGAVVFSDEVESLRKETEALKTRGADIIIALGHSGFETDRKIASEVPLVDVVVGGHTNTFLWNGPAPDSETPEDLYPKVVTQAGGKKVPVVQAYAYTKYLGILNVTFDDVGDLVTFQGQPEFLDGSVEQDADILQLLDKYRPAVDELDRKVVGKAPVVLDAAKCRVAECNFGNLIADVFVFYMAYQHSGEGWTDTPIGLVNGGSIRTTVDPTARGGNVTRGELMGTMPFGNQIVSLSLTGKELLETLEIGARSNGETSRGEFLQVSGLQVVYDMSRPSYSRVVSVKARCGDCKIPTYKAVVPEQLYNVVTVSFLTNGGDSHRFLKDGRNKMVQDLEDVDMIQWYFSQQGLVYPEEEGRLTFIHDSKPSLAGTISLSYLTLALLLGTHLYQLIEML